MNELDPQTHHLRQQIQDAVLEHFIAQGEPATRRDIVAWLGLSSPQRLVGINLDAIYGLERAANPKRHSTPAWQPSPELLRRTIVQLREAQELASAHLRDCSDERL
jgi:hypothetical protein